MAASGATAAEPIPAAGGQTQFTALIKPQIAQNLSQKKTPSRKNWDHLWTSLLSTLCQQSSKSWEPSAALTDPKALLPGISMAKQVKKLPCPSSKGLQLQPAARRAQSIRKCQKTQFIFREIHQLQKFSKCEWLTHVNCQWRTWSYDFYKNYSRAIFHKLNKKGRNVIKQKAGVHVVVILL